MAERLLRPERSLSLGKLIDHFLPEFDVRLICLLPIGVLGRLVRSGEHRDPGLRGEQGRKVFRVLESHLSVAL